MHQDQNRIPRLIMRWTGRVVGSLLVGLFVLIFVGESFGEGSLEPLLHLTPVEVIEWLAVLLAIAGMVAAWWRERLGGWLAVAGGVIFNVVESISEGWPRPVWFAILFTVVGLLFIAAGTLSGGQPD